MCYNSSVKGEKVERLQIIYNNGTNIEISACNGTYNAIMSELKKKKPAKFITPPENSRYKYCVSLENIMVVDKLQRIDTKYTMGFTTDSAKKKEKKKL